MITGIDHVQIAVPRDAESDARAFYSGLLSMVEIPKPEALAGRGGCWFRSGSAILHVGVEDGFTPAKKAHPAFLVDDLERLQETLTSAGFDCRRSDNEIPGILRFHTFDPFGNRIEFQQA